jgi:hypothetical protein
MHNMYTKSGNILPCTSAQAAAAQAAAAAAAAEAAVEVGFLRSCIATCNSTGCSTR